MIVIARRGGTVRWRKSGYIEQLSLMGDHVMAVRFENATPHPLDMTYERFNCSEVGATPPPPQTPVKTAPAPTPVPAPAKKSVKNPAPTKKPLKNYNQDTPSPKQRFDSRREQTIQVLQRRSR